MQLTTDKLYLLNVFDRAIEKTTKLMIQKSQPIPMSKRNTFVGSYIVHKNDEGFYDVIEISTNNVIYKDLYLYESAILIAQKHNKGFRKSINEIIEIDKNYSKHRIDMLHYLNCYKIAAQRRDVERMSILEDKFYMSEQLSKLTKKQMTKFKIIK